MTFQEYLSEVKDNSYVLVKHKEAVGIRRADSWSNRLELLNREVKPMQYCEDWRYAVEII